MKFMRDVYNMTTSPEGASSVPPMPVQSQGFQSNQGGLSTQFNQTWPQYHQQPPPPSPVAYPPYQPPPSPVSFTHLAPSPNVGPLPDPQQPYNRPHGSWSIPPTPMSPLSPPGGNAWSPAPVTYPVAAGEPMSGQPISPPTIMSPASAPQSYNQQTLQWEPQYFPPQPPPLPLRPVNHRPSASWNPPSAPGPFTPTGPDGSPVAVSGNLALPQYSPNVGTPSVPCMENGVDVGPVSPQSNSPQGIPPPLPPRKPSQPTSTPDPAGAVSIHANQPAYNYDAAYPTRPPPVHLIAPVPTGCHEMDGDSPPAHPPPMAELSASSEVSIRSDACVPSRPGSISARGYEEIPVAGVVVELPASLVWRKPLEVNVSRNGDRERRRTWNDIPRIISTAAPPESESASKTGTATGTEKAKEEETYEDFQHRDLGVSLPPLSLAHKRSFDLSLPKLHDMSAPPPVMRDLPPLPGDKDAPGSHRHVYAEAGLEVVPLRLHASNGERGTYGLGVTTGRRSRSKSAVQMLPYPQETDSVVCMPTPFSSPIPVSAVIPMPVPSVAQGGYAGR